MTYNREEHLYLAKICEQAERYDEVSEHMKQVAYLSSSDNRSKELTDDERNLLSVGYKNCVGARRAAWRDVCSVFVKKN